jgi:hypothetical protein
MRPKPTGNDRQENVSYNTTTYYTVKSVTTVTYGANHEVSSISTVTTSYYAGQTISSTYDVYTDDYCPNQCNYTDNTSGSYVIRPAKYVEGKGYLQATRMAYKNQSVTLPDYTAPSTLVVTTNGTALPIVSALVDKAIEIRANYPGRTLYSWPKWDLVDVYSQNIYNLVKPSDFSPISDPVTAISMIPIPGGAPVALLMGVVSWGVGKAEQAYTNNQIKTNLDLLLIEAKKEGEKPCFGTSFYRWQ